MNTDIHKERLILENQGLIHSYLRKCRNIEPHSEVYDDLFSIGVIGLIKAINTFDPSKNIKFSTYATQCINNEICLDFRKSNKYKDDISIHEPIAIDNSGKSLLLEDTLEDKKANFVEDFINQDILVKAIDIILNDLNSRERLIMLYYLADYTQREMTSHLNLSQPQVSRLLNTAIRKIQKTLKTRNCYSGLFSIFIYEHKYSIEFLTDGITNFNYSVFLKKLNPTSNFNISQQGNRIIIILPIAPDSYLFIIKIIEVLQEFVLHHTII